MNDLISNGPVDVAPECSSVPWFALFPLPSSHHRVGEDPRWCLPHLNAIANTFLDIWGLLYACSLLFLLTSYPAAAPQYLLFFFFFFKPLHKHILFKIIWRTVASFKPRGDSFTPLEKYTTHFMTFQRGAVRPSSPGPFNTAQPEFLCCKTKLTMLFYIYVFVYTCNVFCCMYVWVWDLWFYPWYAWSMA